MSEPLAKVYGLYNYCFLVYAETIEELWFWINERTEKTRLYSTKNTKTVSSNRSVKDGEVFIVF